MASSVGRPPAASRRQRVLLKATSCPQGSQGVPRHRTTPWSLSSQNLENWKEKRNLLFVISLPASDAVTMERQAKLISELSL